jgi:hypothetical protein
LKGGFYGGQISTAGNGTADYALIVASNAQGTFGYTGGTNASLSIAGANTDGFQVGFAIKGNTSNATGVILSINATTITYLPTSGTFITNETISTDPASYSQISGSPYTVTTSPLESLTVPKPPLAANTKYYVRVRYSTTTPSAIDSDWSPWSGFNTGSLIPAIGALFGGGYFAGQILDGTTVYNLVVAPVLGDPTGPNPAGTLQGQLGGATPTLIQYKTSSSADTPSATVQNEVYGGPTTDLFKSSGVHPVFSTFINGASGPNAGAFNLATGGAGGGTGIGGYNDWYLPAKNELAVLYFFLKPGTTTNDTFTGSNPNSVAPYTPNTNYGPGFPNVTSSALFAGGAQAFTASTTFYWASTEGLGATTNAWGQIFNVGNQGANGKGLTYYARAVRRIAA